MYKYSINNNIIMLLCASGGEDTNFVLKQITPKVVSINNNNVLINYYVRDAYECII